MQDPTPVQLLDSLRAILSTNHCVKRDDLTGIGLDGNRVCKLEYLLARDRQQGAKAVFTAGGPGGRMALSQL